MLEKSKNIQVSIAEMKSIHAQSNAKLLIKITQLQHKIEHLQQKFDTLKRSHEQLQQTANQRKEKTHLTQAEFGELLALLESTDSKTTKCEMSRRKQEKYIQSVNQRWLNNTEAGDFQDIENQKTY